MKKSRLAVCCILALIAALSISAGVTAFAASDSVATVAALQQKIDGGSREIVFSSDISDGGTVTVTGKSNLTIDGNGHSISGSLFNVTNSSAVTFKNIRFIGGIENIVSVKDCIMLKFNDCSFSDATGYAVKVNSTDAENPSIVEVNSVVTGGNGLGFMLLEGGSYLSINGGVTHNDEIKNQQLEDQIRTGENDKNIGPSGEMGIAIVHKADDAIVNFTFDGYLRPYVRFEATLSGAKTIVYIVPYDNRAPEFNLLSVTKNEVTVNTQINLKDVEISDNKTPKASLKISFSVKTPIGADMPLTDSDATYLSGSAFTPDTVGTYEVKCVAQDLYGNVSHPRYIYYHVQSQQALDVINSPYIKRNYNVGEKITLPVYTTVGGETCTVKVYNPDGAEVTLSENSFTPKKAGVYKLVASYGNAQKQVSLSISGAGSTVIPPQVNVLAIVLISVFSVIFVGGVAVIVVFTLRLKKQNKN